MVHARLHIICGNCGAIATNDREDNFRTTDLRRESGVILCTNCSTIHYISDTVPSEIEHRQEVKAYQRRAKTKTEEE